MRQVVPRHIPGTAQSELPLGRLLEVGINQVDPSVVGIVNCRVRDEIIDGGWRAVVRTIVTDQAGEEFGSGYD
jgi:hypothetical protein